MIPGRQFAGHQIVGQRQRQEDDFGFYRPNPDEHPPERLLAVLADGMGGEVGGREASELVVAGFVDAYIAAKGTIPSRLEAALHLANRQVGDAIRNNTALQGMGCTLVALVFSKEGVYWVSVGDSLLFVIRDGKTIRLNADHSLGSELDEKAKRGEIPVLEAKNAPDRNMLLSAITGNLLHLIDASHQAYSLQKGDYLLLASDGLATLDQNEIGKIFTSLPKGGAEELSNLLLAAVQEKCRPNQDNTTVLVLAPDALPLQSTKPPRRWLHWIPVLLVGMLLGAILTWGVLWLREGIPLANKLEQTQPMEEKAPDSGKQEEKPPVSGFPPSKSDPGTPDVLGPAKQEALPTDAGHEQTPIADPDHQTRKGQGAPTIPSVPVKSHAK